MKSVAIIDKGIVQNIIVVEDGKEGLAEIEARNGIDVTNLLVGKGWRYDGQNFIEPEPTPEQLEAKAKWEEKQAKIESAKTKLASLGLEEDEINALLEL